MKINETPLLGSWLIDIEPHVDRRGFFARTFCADEFADAGLDTNVAQCSVSFTERAGTLRGMHFQTRPFEETKLVRCTGGAIFDVIVDIRGDSPTFGAWFGTELSSRNRTAMYVPKGFAHGFQTLTDRTEVLYQMDTPYAPDHAFGFRWNDPRVGIEWPREPTQISDADGLLPMLEDLDV